MLELDNKYLEDLHSLIEEGKDKMLVETHEAASRASNPNSNEQLSLKQP